MYPCDIDITSTGQRRRPVCFGPASVQAALQTAGLPALTPSNSFPDIHHGRQYYSYYFSPLSNPSPNFFQIFLVMSATSTFRRRRRPRSHLVSLSDRELPRAALPTFIQLVLNTTLRPLRRSPRRRLSLSSRRRPHTASVLKPRGSPNPLVPSL
jgi:hypothetical protein